MTTKSSVCSAIKREISIVDYAEQIGLHVKPFGARGQYNTVEHDSLIITPNGGSSGEDIFHWKSRDIGGSVIDFAMAANDIDEQQAISLLRKMLSGQPTKKYPVSAAPARQPPPAPVKTFEIPQKSNTGYKRLYAYLIQTRGIDKDVVHELVNKKLLVQDNRGNVCFLGKNYEGKYQYGAQRGTMTDKVYRGDVAGSRKEVGFTYNVIGGTPRQVFVVEAPIDALSLMSMLKYHGRDYTQYGYISLGGTSPPALAYHLPHHPQIQKIYLCQDNDEAGNKSRLACREKLKEMGFKGQVTDKPPTPGSKDFNDDLLKIRSSKPEQSNQQLIERGLHP